MVYHFARACTERSQRLADSVRRINRYSRIVCGDDLRLFSRSG